MTVPSMTIAEILGHEPALMDLPTFFKACGVAQSTGYQITAEGRLPLEVIPFGRRRFVRTVEAWKFLGLLPQENADSPRYQPGESAGNDGEAGYQPASPVEQSALTAK